MRRQPLLLCMLLVLVAGMARAGLVPVSGRVIDLESGKPIPGALIGVYESGRGTVKTDSRGRFKVVASPGKRIIYYDGGNPFYHSDGSTYTSVTVPSSGLKDVTFRLLRVQFAHGKVFMPSGMPLVGAQVTVGGEYFTKAVTDKNGRFKIEVPQEPMSPGG